MKRTCKRCRAEIPAARPDGQTTHEDYLIVTFTAQRHVLDYADGYPSGDRYEPYDSGTFCGMDCLSMYAAAVYDAGRKP